MKRFYTYILSIALFTLSVFSKELIPQNMSYQLLSSEKRRELQENNERYGNMQMLLRDGLIKIELYTPSGEYLGTIEDPKDLTENLTARFDAENLSVKMVNTSIQLR